MGENKRKTSDPILIFTWLLLRYAHVGHAMGCRLVKALEFKHDCLREWEKYSTTLMHNFVTNRNQRIKWTNRRKQQTNKKTIRINEQYREKLSWLIFVFDMLYVSWMFSFGWFVCDSFPHCAQCFVCGFRFVLCVCASLFFLSSLQQKIPR